MESVIYKYNIGQKFFTLSIPKGAKFLSCQNQDDEISMWFMFDIQNKNNLDLRTFYSVYTGEPFSNKGLEYLATVQNKNGLVYHFFEIVS